MVALALSACSHTQIAQDSSDGFGGTGTSVQVAYQPTGDESGFGGTGVIGTIEAFGSIWVNGLHIHYPESHTFPANIPGDYRLQIGQQVQLQTDLNTQRLYSRHIQIYFPIAGKIRAIEENRIQIGDQWIAHNSETQLAVSALKVGDYVLVSGFQNGSAWHATRISDNPLKIQAIQSQPQWPFEFAVRQFVVEQPWQSVAPALSKRADRVLIRQGRFSETFGAKSMNRQAPFGQSSPNFSNRQDMHRPLNTPQANGGQMRKSH